MSFPTGFAMRNGTQAVPYNYSTNYGIKKGDAAYSSESACVAMLMKLYQQLTAKSQVFAEVSAST